MKKIILFICLLLATASCYSEDKIPKKIMGEIIAKAEKEHPDDYTMQVYKIKWQADDYLKIQEIKERSK